MAFEKSRNFPCLRNMGSQVWLSAHPKDFKFIKEVRDYSFVSPFFQLSVFSSFVLFCLFASAL